ncbi:MAG: hypothetical protein PHY28_02400 [Dehalococcoidales bacterium]|nr:hypothetical protein [Dehalococcoidales bacterium]
MSASNNPNTKKLLASLSPETPANPAAIIVAKLKAGVSSGECFQAGCRGFESCIPLFMPDVMTYQVLLQITSRCGCVLTRTMSLFSAPMDNPVFTTSRPKRKDG